MKIRRNRCKRRIKTSKKLMLMKVTVKIKNRKRRNRRKIKLAEKNRDEEEVDESHIEQNCLRNRDEEEEEVSNLSPDNRGYSSFFYINTRGHLINCLL